MNKQKKENRRLCFIKSFDIQQCSLPLASFNKQFTLRPKYRGKVCVCVCGGGGGGGGGGRGQSILCLTQNFIFRKFEFDRFLYRIYPNKYSLTLLLILLKFQQVHFTICEPV